MTLSLAYPPRDDLSIYSTAPPAVVDNGVLRGSVQLPPLRSLLNNIPLPNEFGYPAGSQFPLPPPPPPSMGFQLQPPPPPHHQHQHHLSHNLNMNPMNNMNNMPHKIPSLLPTMLSEPMPNEPYHSNMSSGGSSPKMSGSPLMDHYHRSSMGDMTEISHHMHTNRKYKCKICERSFTTSGHLARHSRIHTGERKHVCPFPDCDARFARQDNCMQHYRTHVSGKTRKRRTIKTKKV